MFKPKNQQERVGHRLKIAKGHLEKVITMVEEQKYCIEILHQLNAIESALKETGNLVLENHLKTCAADAIREGRKEKAISEIMEVFKRKV